MVTLSAILTTPLICDSEDAVPGRYRRRHKHATVYQIPKRYIGDKQTTSLSKQKSYSHFRLETTNSIQYFGCRRGATNPRYQFPWTYANLSALRQKSNHAEWPNCEGNSKNETTNHIGNIEMHIKTKGQPVSQRACRLAGTFLKSIQAEFDGLLSGCCHWVSLKRRTARSDPVASSRGWKKSPIRQELQRITYILIN